MVQATEPAHLSTFAVIRHGFVLEVGGTGGVGGEVLVLMEVCTTAAAPQQPAASADVWPASEQERGPQQQHTLLPTSFILLIAAGDCCLLY